MGNQNDGELASRLLQGDQSAFAILFRRYYSDLVLFAFTFLKDKHTSEETVQDVFIRLWENRETLIISSSLKSFLLKSIQNKCIDIIRHNRIRELYEKNSLLQSTVLLENDTESYILFSELEDDLEKALKELPDELSGIFRMNRFEGKTYAEIAAISNVSVRTIEVRMGRALAMLREKLKDYLILLIAGLISFGS